MRHGFDQNIPHHDLLLLGGGHAHVQVIKMLSMSAIKHLRVTLISDVSFAPYSGMLPGFLAGFYDYQAVHFDLPNLCAKAGVRFIHSAATVIEPREQMVSLSDGTTVGYDILSINVGCSPDLTGVLDHDHVLPMKPISGFLAKWDQLTKTIRQTSAARRVAVVGGGAAGFEIAMLLKCQLLKEYSPKSSVHLLQSTASVLPSHPKRLQRILTAKAENVGIVLHVNTTIKSFRDKILITDRGESIGCDFAIWATQAAAPPLLRRSPLATDDRGFLRVNSALQSLEYPNIFGAGDCIAFPVPLAKSGVFAVREASTLHANILRLLAGRKLRAYKPQARHLSLITAGEKKAYASRRIYLGGGHMWWLIKNHIDRKFMQRWQSYPTHRQPEVKDAYVPNICGGCGSKVDPQTLFDGLESTKTDMHHDDAVVTTLPSGHRIAESVDSFRTFISDEFIFGKIAALNALSDLYAMGATPVSVQALLQLADMPIKLVQRDMQRVLAGVSAALAQDEVDLTGGHTTIGKELQLGFAVLGIFAADAPVLPKQGAKNGDQLILTKPLGTGACLAAHMYGALAGDDLEEILGSMQLSNRLILDLARRYKLSAVTDVTGFGLAGHLVEMLGDKSKPEALGLCLTGDLPIFAGYERAIAAGYQSSIATGIRRYVKKNRGNGADALADIWFDPQTSGGLLISLEPNVVDAVLRDLHAAGFAEARVIGTFTLLSSGKTTTL